MSLIFRHSQLIFFTYNFLNNGPIFNPIELLELFHSMVFSIHVYMICTYMSWLSKYMIQNTLVSMENRLWVSKDTYKPYKHEIKHHRMLEETEMISTIESDWKSDHY